MLYLELFLKFGENLYFLKKNLPNKTKIIVNSEKCALIHTTTTCFYNKFS